MEINGLLEEDDIRELVRSRSTETKLNLSKCNLTILPNAYPLTLKQVHLKGNNLKNIPGSIFTDLPNLIWLDLRDNELRDLPPQIQCAYNLKDLLLGGNLFLQLPGCLANLPKLTGLQLQPNPLLQHPPKEIVQNGIKAVMKYLREFVFETPAEPELNEEVSSFTPPDLIKVSTQNRILQLSLKKPISLTQYKEAMDKHISEEKVPVHLKKWDTMSEEQKVDRTIQKSAIQMEIQRMNDEKERQNFARRDRRAIANPDGDGSNDINFIFNHAENAKKSSLGDGRPAQSASDQQTFFR